MKNNPAHSSLSRRQFIVSSVAAAGAAAAPHSIAADASSAAASHPGRPDSGPCMKIAEIFGPQDERLWRLMLQSGVTHVVATFGRGSSRSGGEKPWSYSALESIKKAHEANGFEVAVLESRPPTDKIKLGLPGRDEQIEEVCEMIRNLGKVHIPVWCYEWMPVINWLRTSTDLPSRGGALVTGFDLAKVQDQPLTQHGTLTEDQSWTNLRYFLERVLPVAEKAGVKLAMHPDDPPLSPLRGLARLMRSVENYRRLLDLVPSEANGITLCQGNFTLMTGDLPAVIRQFGSRIFFVHFRDVKGTPEKFEETFHDAGMTDMAECIRAYREIGFNGVCRSDHVPTMEGDSNDRPGYSTIGRLFAVGYIRGLIQSVYSERGSGEQRARRG